MKKISILGMGRWASCLAYILDSEKYKITMWERDRDGGSELFLTHANRYLTLPDKIEFSHNLAQAISNADVVIISILSQNLNNLMQEIKKVDGYSTKYYCIAMKGIEQSSARRLSEIMLDNGIAREKIAVWVGPGHVQSISAGGAANMVISAYDDNLAHKLANAFSTKKINISTSADIIGTELGAAAKNVYGIAAGIFHACPNYEHCIGGLMVASVKEMAHLIDALGGRKDTANGLALLGDYQATMFDEYSKNLTYGKTIIKLNTLNKDILNDYIFVNSVEGIPTTSALLSLKDKYNQKVSDSQKVNMPIAETIFNIINGNIPLDTAGEQLFKTVSAVLNNNQSCNI